MYKPCSIYNFGSFDKEIAELPPTKKKETFWYLVGVTLDDKKKVRVTLIHSFTISFHNFFSL